jgi:hypothetical protein
MPVEVLQKMLAAVVPFDRGIASVAEGSDGPKISEYRRAKSQGWEQRLKTVISDLANVTSLGSGSRASPQLVDYRFVVGRLGRLGLWRTCELIAQEAQARGWELDKGFMDHRVMAMVRCMEIRKASTEKATKRKGVKPVMQALWSVLDEMERRGISPTDLARARIVRAVELLREGLRDDTTDAKEKADQLLEELLVKSYGLDLKYFTFGDGIKAEESKYGIGDVALKALIKYLGDRGEVYRMVAAFEVLTERRARDEAITAREEVEVEEEYPTLSQMEANEREGRKQLGWFGRKAGGECAHDASADSVAQGVSNNVTSEGITSETSASASSEISSPRIWSDFLSPLPSPQALSTALSSDYSRYREFEPGLFQALIQAACKADDLPLALHIVETALRNTAKVRTAWLAALISSAAVDSGSEQAGPSAHPAAAPRLQVTADWFMPVAGLLRRVKGDVEKRQRFWGILEGVIQRAKEEQAVLDLPLHKTQADPTSATAPSSEPLLLSDIFDVQSASMSLATLIDEVEQVLARSRAQRLVASQAARRRKAARLVRLAEVNAGKEAARVEQEEARVEKERRRAERAGRRDTVLTSLTSTAVASGTGKDSRMEKVEWHGTTPGGIGA